MTFKKSKETTKQSITVGFFVESNKTRLHLTSLTGDVGYNKELKDKNVHRPQLVLAGYVQLFRFDRVQIFGNTEMRYLEQCTPEYRENALKTIFQFDVPCVVVTNNNPVDETFIRIAKERGVPVLQTPLETTKCIYFLSDFLDDQFSPQTVVHGSFVDVYGVGLLLIGRSGIGKSEIALDLVMRGHRLVADDIVNLLRRGGDVYGQGNEMIQHHMEIRGLGILNIKDLFGVASVRDRKKIELVIELVEWNSGAEYDRLGLEQESMNILGAELPHAVVPVRPGRNMTTIVEVAARNHLLKLRGHHSAQEFAERLSQVLSKNGTPGQGRLAVPSMPTPRPAPHHEEDVE